MWGGGRLLSDIIYPVGSIYLSVSNTDPSTYFGGTWQKIGTGRVLMGASSDNQLGTTVDSGLPNITGRVIPRWADSTGQGIIISDSGQGALYTSWSGVQNWFTNQNELGGTRADTINFDASRVNSIYGRSSIVQPPAYYCYMWRRISWSQVYDKILWKNL